MVERQAYPSSLTAKITPSPYAMPPVNITCWPHGSGDDGHCQESPLSLEMPRPLSVAATNRPGPASTNTVRRTLVSKAKGRVSRSASGVDARKRVRQLTADRNRLTEEIERAEARIHEINEIFCDPAYFDRTPRDEVQGLEREQVPVQAQQIF